MLKNLTQKEKIWERSTASIFMSGILDNAIFRMSFHSRQSRVYVSRTPKRLQGDIKFHQLNFWPGERDHPRNSRRRWESGILWIGKKEKASFASTSLFKETKALHFSENDAFLGEFPANCRAHLNKSGRLQSFSTRTDCLFVAEIKIHVSVNTMFLDLEKWLSQLIHKTN